MEEKEVGEDGQEDSDVQCSVKLILYDWYILSL